MAWLRPPPLSPSETLVHTLSYSNQFDYPLTLFEVWFWQSSRQSLRSLRRWGTDWPHQFRGFYFLPGRKSLPNIRMKRAMYSQKKWKIARAVAIHLQKIPTLQAVFLTGALAMNNSSRFDDVDILLVTSPHTLWFTRALVVLLLKLLRLRRDPRLPEHSSPRVSDKICDNLYLDSDHLLISHGPLTASQNLYLAHEVLQAKCLFDRGEVHRKFLTQNSWVKSYLPVAFKETMKQLHLLSPSHEPRATSQLLNILLFTINYLLFTMQYLYMRPHFTTEKVGLGYAFFHPNSSRV